MSMGNPRTKDGWHTVGSLARVAQQTYPAIIGIRKPWVYMLFDHHWFASMYMTSQKQIASARADNQSASEDRDVRFAEARSGSGSADSIAIPRLASSKSASELPADVGRHILNRIEIH